MRTGIMAEGPIEMRQRFYSRILAPRTYFANGGTSYGKSRYLQSFFNQLVDLFPNTHRYLRVDNSRLFIPLGSIVLIYDLTSFTSNFSETAPFVDRLARFFHGTMVQVFDSHEGVVEVPLDELLFDYNTLNDGTTPFSVRRLLPLDEEFFHHTGGFLGVYGNIALCTALHGIVAAIITGSYDLANTAGDDGIMVLNDKELAVLGIRLLGILKLDGVYTETCRIQPEDITSDVQWEVLGDPVISLKRGIRLVGEKLRTQVMVFFPNFEKLYFDRIHRDPRYPLRNDEDIKSYSNSFVSGVRTLLSSMEKIKMTQLEVDFIRSLLSFCYDVLRLKPEGKLPSGLSLGYPSIVGDLFWIKPMETLLMNSYCGLVELRKFADHREGEDEPDWCTAELETVWVGGMSAHRAFMVKMGLLDSTDVLTWYHGEEGFNMLLRLIREDRSLVPVYSFRKTRPIMSHFRMSF